MRGIRTVGRGRFKCVGIHENTCIMSYYTRVKIALISLTRVIL